MIIYSYTILFHTKGTEQCLAIVEGSEHVVAHQWAFSGDNTLYSHSWCII